MKDRVPTKVVGGAIRMEQIDAQGKHLGYIYLRRADEPSEEGTPLNKANMLTDETAEAVGLDPAADPTPNDAFFKLSRLETLRIGDTITTARTITDSRFLRCQGQGVLQGDYPMLYNAIPNRFSYRAANVAWNAATITDTSIVHTVGDYYARLSNADTNQWQYSTDRSEWVDLPHAGRPYYTCGYYMLDSGYICDDLTNSAWHAITYSTDCMPEDGVYTSESYGTTTFPYDYSGCSYDIKDNIVFIIPHYSTDEKTYEIDDEQEYFGRYYTDRVVAVDAACLLTSNVNYLAEGTLIKSLEYFSGNDTDEAMGSPKIIGTGVPYYLLYDYMGTYGKTYKLYSFDLASEPVLIVESTGVLCTNPGQNVVFVGGGLSSKTYTFENTVYVGGKTVTLTKPAVSSGNAKIYAVGYNRNSDTIVYIVNNEYLTGNWITCIYDLSSRKSFTLDSRAALLADADLSKSTNDNDLIDAVLGEDGDGNVYTSAYKLTYDLGVIYVLPDYDSESDDKYMKVRSA